VGFSASFYRKAQLITNLFDKISYQISAQELIDQKWLVPILLKQVMVKKEAEFPERAAIFLKLYLEELKGKKTFVYCNTVEEVKDMTALFISHGIKAAYVTGDVTGQLRRDLMHSFEHGDTDILITCNVLSQGVDSQKLSAILDIYGTGSPTLFIQRSGRLARTEDGKMLNSGHLKQSGTYYTAATAPQIKSGFYKSMVEYALNEGSKKHTHDCFDDKEYLDMLKEPKTSQTYTFTTTLCEIADKFKELGLINIYDMIRTKKIPERYLKSLDLIEVAFKGEMHDNWDSVERSIRENIASDEHKQWIIPTGKMAGKHIKDVSYFYKNWLREKGGNSYAGKLLKKWEEEQRDKKRPKIVKINDRF
jgi:superfamily II DNA or RNA helicase